jgi:hypothetical protein
MMFRKRLICGLLWGAAIAVPTATLAGDDSSAAVDPIPSISFAPSENAPSAWKKSDQPTSAEIRFKKPKPIIFTDQAAAAQAPISKEKSRTSVAASAAPAANKPASARLAPIAAPAAATVMTAPPVATAAQNATAAPALASNKSANPAPAEVTTKPQSAIAPLAPRKTDVIAATAPAAAAAAPAAPVVAPEPQAKTTPESAPIRDDQIQLVAQMLMDRGVIRAAQEEPLPSSPDAVKPTTNGPGSDARGDMPEYLSGEECCPDPCCQPRLMWVGGVEATFLVPDLNSDGVTFAVEEFDTDRADFCDSQDTDVDSMYVAPRIWLGIQGCCWGANVRYWHLQASEGTYDPSIGGIGSWDDYDCGRPDLGYFTCNRLEAYTVDLEITRRFCIHDCWMQAAFGVRHAEIQNNESITGLALTDAGLLNGFARANRYSRGTGIMMGLYGRKPIFPCSCVNWFYNARWSAMWGPTQTSAETFAAASAVDDDFVASAASVNGAYTTIDDTLFMGEIQLGLEWNYALCCMPANAFFRMAIEYQRWDGGDGFSGANSFAGIEVDDGMSTVASLVGTNASAQEPQMDLLGFTIGTGLTW